MDRCTYRSYLILCDRLADSLHPKQTEMIYGLAIFILTLIIDLATDYRRWLKRKPVRHNLGGWLRCIGLVPAGVLLSVSPQLQIQPQIWAVPGAMVFTYWILFNGIYGLLIASNWWFLGTTSKLDRYERTHKWVTVVKYAGCVLFNLLYLILAQ